MSIVDGRVIAMYACMTGTFILSGRPSCRRFGRRAVNNKCRSSLRDDLTSGWTGVRARATFFFSRIAYRTDVSHKLFKQLNKISFIFH